VQQRVHLVRVRLRLRVRRRLLRLRVRLRVRARVRASEHLRLPQRVAGHRTQVGGAPQRAPRAQRGGALARQRRYARDLEGRRHGAQRAAEHLGRGQG
jgi:hypothetical protein